DGDKIIAILAVEMKKKGILNDNKVVTTIMSNMGFENFLNEKNIGLIRANVGDRYVLEKMRNHGLNLGGEQSGHILLLDYSTTGDGVLTSLKLVEALRDSNSNLDERSAEVMDWPQEMINVRVARDKKAVWAENTVITSFITEKESEMKGTGRVLVRTSGTEPIIRVMVEGKDGDMVHRIVKEIADLVKKELAE
ncbi:MAG: phosphoglucosamine mutase, partial [Fusobacteriaceae bacterium]